VGRVIEAAAFDVDVGGLFEERDEPRGCPRHPRLGEPFIVEGRDKGRVFVSAKLSDNPHLDAEEYRKSLAELPLVERMQLEHGE
jgi:hypothetical protein